jgi:hypothetical protein
MEEPKAEQSLSVHSLYSEALRREIQEDLSKNRRQTRTHAESCGGTNSKRRGEAGN